VLNLDAGKTSFSARIDLPMAPHSLPAVFSVTAGSAFRPARDGALAIATLRLNAGNALSCGCPPNDPGPMKRRLMWLLLAPPRVRDRLNNCPGAWRAKLAPRVYRADDVRINHSRTWPLCAIAGLTFEGREAALFQRLGRETR